MRLAARAILIADVKGTAIPATIALARVVNDMLTTTWRTCLRALSMTGLSAR